MCLSILKRCITNNMDSSLFWRPCSSPYWMTLSELLGLCISVCLFEKLEWSANYFILCMCVCIYIYIYIPHSHILYICVCVYIYIFHRCLGSNEIKCHCHNFTNESPLTRGLSDDLAQDHTTDNESSRDLDLKALELSSPCVY